MTFILYNIVDAVGSLAINGSPVGVNLSTPGQNGSVTFSGTSGQLATVYISNNTYGSGITVNLLNPDGSTLTSAFGSGTFNLSQKTLSTTGTYTIQLIHNTYWTGSMNVSVTNP